MVYLRSVQAHVPCLTGNQGSPLAYFTNAGPMYAPDSSRRPRISRSLMRVSEVDYDQIPSPKSYQPMRPSTNGRGPSALSKSFVTQEPTPEPEFSHADPGAFDDFEPPQPNESPPRSRTPEASPEVAEEDEEVAGEDEEAAREGEEVAEVEQAVARSSRVDKGKRRADPVEEDEQPNHEPYDANGLEDDIAHGLEEVENAQGDEDNAPPAKKSKKVAAKSKKPRPEKRVTRTPIERAYCSAGVCAFDSNSCRFPYPGGSATWTTSPLQALGVVAARESCLWAA